MKQRRFNQSAPAAPAARTAPAALAARTAPAALAARSAPAARTALAALGALAALALAASPLTAWASDLELKVENVKDTSGDLRVALYGSAADYRKTAVREMRTAAASDPVSIRITGLAAGDYAIALFHDRNGNQKLDSNLMGIPTEPYGFSGSARNLMGPATWDQARFSVPPDGATVTVRLSD